MLYELYGAKVRSFYVICNSYSFYLQKNKYIYVLQRENNPTTVFSRSYCSVNELTPQNEYTLMHSQPLFFLVFEIAFGNLDGIAIALGTEVG